MATLYGLKAKSPAMMRVDGTSVDIIDKYVQSALLALADVLKFFVPAGAEVANLAFQIDDSDTGTTLLFSVGHEAVDPANATAQPTNATYFAAAGQTTGQAGGRLQCAFKPIKFQYDTYITLTVGAAATGIAGTPEIWMIASCNQNGPK
jgi:hypothetical protein